MIETDKFDKIEIESSEDLRNWLSQNYSNENSFWLVTYKKSETTKYVSAEGEKKYKEKRT